ncbi:MAG: hypothetical protein Q8L27_02890 [archaeon]|nr:hypothetical protein [archaeon]
MNPKQLATFKKTLRTLSVKEQIERLRLELKKKQDKDIFNFLQTVIHQEVKPIKPEFREVRNDDERRIESTLKPKEEFNLENKIAAEKPAFNVEEKSYLVKPSDEKGGYEIKSGYKEFEKQDKSPFDAVEATKSVSETAMEQTRGFSTNAALGFAESLHKNTEKYKRKENR